MAKNVAVEMKWKWWVLRNDDAMTDFSCYWIITLRFTIKLSLCFFKTSKVMNVILTKSHLPKIYPSRHLLVSATRGKMRQLSCYEFQNQCGRESVKSILLHGNLRLYFQTTNKKNDKKKSWCETKVKLSWYKWDRLWMSDKKFICLCQVLLEFFNVL